MEDFLFYLDVHLRLILINNLYLSREIFSFRNPVERIAISNPKTPKIVHICPTESIPTPHNHHPALLSNYLARIKPTFKIHPTHQKTTFEEYKNQ